MTSRNIVQRALYELRYFMYELAALFVVSGTFMIIDYFFAKQSTSIDEIWTKEYSYLPALKQNLLAWNSIFTIIGLAVAFILFRTLGKERADFLQHKVRSHLLAPMRDFLAIIIFSFTAATLANLSVTGTYRVPSSLMIGLVMWWMVPVMLVKAGGLIRPTRATLIEIAVVCGFMAIGWILPPAISGSLSSQNFGDYFVSVTMLYTLGCGVGILAYPEQNLRINVRNRIAVYFIWILTFILGILLFLVPILVMMVVLVFCIPVFAVINAIKGTSVTLEETFRHILETLVIYNKGSNNWAVMLSPFRLIGIYLTDIIGNLAQGSFRAIGESLSLLVSIHFITYMYRPDQQSRYRLSLHNTEQQA